MRLNKLKVSLIVLSLFTLGLTILSLVVAGNKALEIERERGGIADEVSVENSASLIIRFDEESGEELDLTFNEGDSLFAAMKRKFIEESIEFDYKEYSGLGVLVTEIGDKKNGEGNKYWQYWVNGVYAQVGASYYVLQPGDIIEWKFTGDLQ